MDIQNDGPWTGKGIYVKFLGGNLSSCPCLCTPKDMLQKKQELYIHQTPRIPNTWHV